jgi:hypothetical protein
LLSEIHGLPVWCSLISRARRGCAEEGRDDKKYPASRGDVWKMSKGTGSKRNTKIALLIIIIVVVAAGVAFWLSTSSSSGSGTTGSGKIQIPANGVAVSTGGVGGVGSSLNVTVDNVGSVPVTITTIYVNGGAYPTEEETGGTANTFFPDSCFGAPCSSTNGILSEAGENFYNMTVYVIQPGQSITFTVVFGVPLHRGNLSVKVVGSNGAEATVETTW